MVIIDLFFSASILPVGSPAAGCPVESHLTQQAAGDPAHEAGIRKRLSECLIKGELESD